MLHLKDFDCKSSSDGAAWLIQFKSGLINFSLHACIEGRGINEPTSTHVAICSLDVSLTRGIHALALGLLMETHNYSLSLF